MQRSDEAEHLRFVHASRPERAVADVLAEHGEFRFVQPVAGRDEQQGIEAGYEAFEGEDDE